MSFENLNLENLDEGGALEAMNHELSKVLENILDPNTEAKTQRKVTLEVKLKGDENRNICGLSYQAKSTVAPLKPQEVQVIVDRDPQGKAVASELRPGEVPGRQQLPTGEQAKVREIPTGKNQKE